MRSWNGCHIYAFAALLLLGAAARTAWAVEPPFEGKIIEDGTDVRAGGGDVFYVVGHLAKGTIVKVKAAYPLFYEIEAPEGVYSYISKAFVDVRGEGQNGVVNKPAKVTAASLAGAGDSYRLQFNNDLPKGTQVRIVGEDGSFFKIMPPQGATVYVAVSKVVPLASGGAPAGPAAQPTPPTPAVPAPSDPTRAVPMPPATAPSPMTPPATQPAALSPLSPAVAAAEQRFHAAIKLPLEQQPLEELLAAYESLANDATLLPDDQRVVETRLAQLRRNIELARTIKELQGVQTQVRADAAQTQPAPPPPAPAQTYDAVGLLLASNVYDGQSLPMLYRLVSAGDGRTIGYIHPNLKLFDPLKALGANVGVIGDIGFDPSLHVQIINVQRLDVLRKESK